MLKLTEGMLLYHGSYTEVREIDLDKCKKGLDFGHGFYVSSSYEQAYHLVQNAVKKAKRMGEVPDDFDVRHGIVNVYRFHQNPDLVIHCFEEADAEWLHFIAANRDNSLFPRLLMKHQFTDVIGGKVPDDNTSRVLNQYVEGFLGTQGTDEADRWALKMLLPERLENQLCFRTPEAIFSLEFVRSDLYGSR